MSISQNKNYKWFLVGLLWVVALLNYMDRQILSTMQKSMMIDIHELQSATNFGYLMGIFLWVYGLMSPISGIIADKFSRKWIIVGSLFVWSAVTYGMGMADTFQQVYWLRAVMGVSEALYIPAGLSLIADFHTGKTRSLAIGIHMTGLYAGQALGGYGAMIAAELTWHSTFHWFGIIGMSYAVILILFLREKKEDKISIETDQIAISDKIPLFKGLAMLFSNMAFWIILFYFAVPSLPGWATKNWLPTLFSENLNLPMEIAGPYATIFLAASACVGVFIGGPLSDWWVQKNIRGRIYTSAIGLGLTIPSLLFLGYGDSLFTMFGAAICFGIGFGMFDANNMPILCQFVPRKLRATAYGFMNLVGVLGGAMITEILGRSTDEGSLGQDFALLGGIVLIVLIIQLIFLRPKHQDFT